MAAFVHGPLTSSALAGQATTSSAFHPFSSTLQPASEPVALRQTTAHCVLASFPSNSHPGRQAASRIACQVADLFSLDEEYSRYGLSRSVHSWSAVTRRQRRERGAARCLQRGVGSGFWEGADSDSSASNPSDARQRLRPGEARGCSVLLSLIQEVEPLDVRHISKDASADSMDAMKRTVSGMLGLLPPDQFHVSVEADRGSLARLLVSSMMTGYTLRNAEYRLCLQRTLELELPDAEEDAAEGDSWQQQGSAPPDASASGDWAAGGAGGGDGSAAGGERASDGCGLAPTPESAAGAPWGGGDAAVGPGQIPEGLGELSPAAQAYMQHLQAQMAAVSQDLEACKRALASAEVESVADQNDLLDYLRGLDPEKVAELSQPTSPDVEEAIQHVVDSLLGRASGPPAGAPPPPHEGPFGNAAPLPTAPGSATAAAAAAAAPWDRAPDVDVASNVALPFQSSISLSREYLARLLFWCMLLGHHMRALEYRLELSRTFSLSV